MIQWGLTHQCSGYVIPPKGKKLGHPACPATLFKEALTELNADTLHVIRGIREFS